MTISNVVGIIGWPVAHSLSPAMHNRAFLEAGLASWFYIPMPVVKPEDRLKEAVLGLRALGLKGANVTVPYKEAVLPFLDRISDTAKAIGAVNTIAIDSDDRLVGHNTDCIGFIEDLKEHKVDVQKMRILILGAGGSARAITFGLLKEGCKSITILNRTKSKANDIAKDFHEIGNKTKIKTGQLDRDSIKGETSADLIINTTSIGLLKTAQKMPWDENIHFNQHQIVYDLIYNPSVTIFLQHANSDGAKTINGIGMLLHQGAASFEIWTGVKAPLRAMKSALMEAIK